MKHKVIALVLGSLLVFLLMSHSNGYAAALPFGVPTANTNIDGLVPIDLAEKIAVKRAHKYWGQAILGPTLVCADDDGDVVAYMFTFALDEQTFPSYLEIQSMVQYGRNIDKGGFDSLTDDDKQKVNNEIEKQVNKEVITPDSLLVVTPGGPDYAHSKKKKDLEARKLGRRKMIGADEFGTIVVSARFDHFPVPLYTKYLPPYFFQGDLAVIAAAKALSAESVTFDKIYFIENLRSIFFGFSSNQNTVLLNAYSLDVVPVVNALILKSNKIAPSPDMLSEINEAWAHAKKDVE